MTTTDEQRKDENWYKTASETEIGKELRLHLKNQQTVEFISLLNNVAEYCTKQQDSQTRKEQHEDEKKQLSLSKIVNNFQRKPLIDPLLIAAIKVENMEAIKAIIKYNVADMNFTTWLEHMGSIGPPIKTAIEVNNDKIVTLLLENGVKPPKDEEWGKNDMIQLAIRNQNVEICKLLTDPSNFSNYTFWKYDWVCISGTVGT